MARDPMMQQSPAMPDMAGANMRGGNPMQDLPQKGKDNLAKPQAEIAAVLVARLGLMSPQELEMLDMAITPEVADVLLKLLPELAELIDAVQGQGMQPQAAGPRQAAPASQTDGRTRLCWMMIRLATVMDLSELYHMLYVMHSETSHNLSPIVSEKLTTAISMSLHRGVVLVAEVDGHIIGSIGGMETTDWWSDEKYLADMWFFVYKEHRKSTAAIKLVKSFMQIGKDASIRIKLGHVYSGDLERKDNFYERLGLCKVGSMYTEA
jgi:hypothetical protein